MRFGIFRDCGGEPVRAGAEGLFDVSFLGEGFVLLAQIFYALSGSLVKKHSQKFDVVTLSGYQFMAGGFVLAAVGLAWGGSLSGAVSPFGFPFAFVYGLFIRHSVHPLGRAAEI